VFTAGHSFHVFVADILPDIARAAGVAGHVNLGAQFLGGSRTAEHWDLPDAGNAAKRALRTGRVDVLTLSPTVHPDPGVERFARLAVAHNPDARVTVQESWVPFDGLIAARLRPGSAGRDGVAGDDLRALHEPYFRGLAADVAAVNRAVGRPVLAVVPVGHALIALRERVRAGRAPGVRSQEELFTDPMGHPGPVVRVLTAYAHFAVIYRQSPVGLPAPAALAGVAGRAERDGLNRLLQELARDAAAGHPLSGVAGGATPASE
jgi:hypothetical protein